MRLSKPPALRLNRHLATVRAFLPGMDQLALASDWAESRDTVILVVLAIVVGILCGLAAAAFTWLIGLIASLAFPVGGLPSSSPLARDLTIVLAPTVGGLIVGPLIKLFAREARGHGVPAVMRALVERGGKIHPKVAIIKTLASAITLGSGGSAGREGPIVQIGATLGSVIGQITRVRERHLRTLVICGAAARESPRSSMRHSRASSTEPRSSSGRSRLERSV